MAANQTKVACVGKGARLHHINVFRAPPKSGKPLHSQHLKHFIDDGVGEFGPKLTPVARPERYGSDGK